MQSTRKNKFIRYLPLFWQHKEDYVKENLYICYPISNPIPYFA